MRISTFVWQTTNLWDLTIDKLVDLLSNAHQIQPLIHRKILQPEVMEKTDENPNIRLLELKYIKATGNTKTNKHISLKRRF